jgi:hypothetical protein
MPIPKPCPKKAVAGQTWIILSFSASCSAAQATVGKLVTKKVPAGRKPYPGTFAGGLRCVGGPNAGALPRSIICGVRSTTGFTAFKS